MSNESNKVHISPAASRREILRAAGAAALGGMADCRAGRKRQRSCRERDRI
jgi:hypothetical protein